MRTTHLMRSAAASAFILALTLYACGSGEGSPVLSVGVGPTQAGDCEAQSRRGDDPSVNDDRPPSPGGRSTSASGQFAPGSADDRLAGAEFLAVLRVVDRGEPRQKGPSLRFGARQPGDGKDAERDADLAGSPLRSVPRVVRPILFRAEQALKGVVPRCLLLEVPGGSAGDVTEETGGLFPHRLRVGDRVLAFLTTGDVGGAPVPLWSSLMLAVSPEGIVRFPFDGTTVDLDTFELSARAKRPPEAVTEAGPSSGMRPPRP